MTPIHPVRFLYPVRLKHKDSGRYLFSASAKHAHVYSSRQQLVGIAGKPDNDCIWVFKHSNNTNTSPVAAHAFSTGDTVRLEHVATKKNLHSHGGDYHSFDGSEREITAFGGLGVGDGNDDWKITIASVDEFGDAAEVELQHANTKWFLAASDALYPSSPKHESRAVDAIEILERPRCRWVVERTDLPPIPLSEVVTEITLPLQNFSLRAASSADVENWTAALSKFIADESALWESVFVSDDIDSNVCTAVALRYRSAFERMREVVAGEDLLRPRLGR